MAAPPEATPAAEPITRVPHMDAPEELVTAAGTPFAVEVWLDDVPPHPGESGEPVRVEMPAGQESIDLGVLLTPSSHFELHGEQYRTVRLDRRPGTSARVSFELTVSAAASDGPAGISALFLYGGRPCGRVARSWNWIRSKKVAGPGDTAPPGAPVVPVHTDASEPDLTVLIEAPVNTGLEFTCSILTPLLPGYDKPQGVRWGMPVQASVFVRERLEGVVDSRRTPRQRLVALRAAGYEFFDAAPPLFRTALWELVDAGKRPRSIYVASAEPSLPWELMIPRRQKGRPGELRPLGVEFPIGRWTRADGASPSPDLVIDGSVVIAPKYTSQPLDVTAEVDFIRQSFAAKRAEPATYDHIDKFVGNAKASLIHYVGHGVAGIDGDDTLVLEDAELASRELLALPGWKSSCEASKPLVFLNACEVAQQQPSIGGGAGFPRAFGDIGAKAVIAPLWPVQNTIARSMAERIYNGATTSTAPAVAEVMRRIREEAYEAEDAPDTLSAYCFFGDPTARLRR
jgi:hypothetical protein